MLFWLLKFLPALLIHGFMGLALLAFGLSYVPFIPYKYPLKWGGLAAIALGLFLEGCLLTQQAWEAQVAALQERIKISEEKAQQINTQVETQYITQTKTIHEKGDQIVKYIDREVTKIDNTCEIAPIVIAIHNAAATNTPLDEVPVTPNTMVDTAAHNAAAVPK